MSDQHEGTRGGGPLGGATNAPIIDKGTLARTQHRPSAPASGSAAQKAASPQANASQANTIRVLFFGGYHASQDDINAWLASARAQRPEVSFDGNPWPKDTAADDKSALAGFGADRLHQVIAHIKSSGASKFYIVGHSSGCAIANAVDRGLKDNSTSVLVALDGFVPGSKQLERETTQCWGAVCGDVKSMNYEAMQKSGRFHSYTATDCKTKWALHFSLVNAAANDRAVTSVPTGYTQCKANLMWLK